MNVKQVIVIRRDLNMRRGKEIAQGAHAAMMFLSFAICRGLSLGPVHTFKHFSEEELLWISGGFKKVVCQVQTEQELRDLQVAAHRAWLTAHLVEDAGHTEFGGVPTITALAIGPDTDERLEPITGQLKLY